MAEVHAIEKELMTPWRRIAFLKSKIEAVKSMFPKGAILDPYFQNIIKSFQEQICRINNDNFDEDEIDVDEVLSGDIEQDRQDELLEELTE